MESLPPGLADLSDDGEAERYVDALLESTNVGAEAPSVTRAEKSLLCCCLCFLRDYFPPEDFTPEGITTLVSMAQAADEEEVTPLGIMVDEIVTGKYYRIDAETGKLATAPSTFERRDGLRPADCGGFTADGDSTLMYYGSFKSGTPELQKDAAYSCLLRLRRLEESAVKADKEEGDGSWKQRTSATC